MQTHHTITVSCNFKPTLKKHSEIFLFGAGAISDWNGPTTYELTNLIRQSGFPVKSSNMKITEFIYQKLCDSGYEEDEINFETIINVIEELAIYYSDSGLEKKTPSLLRAFLNDDNLDDIFNFSIKNGIREHNYKLNIPKDIEYKHGRSSLNGENPKQFFLQHLLSVIITNINARISKYAYHTKGNSVIEQNSDESVLLKNWLRKKEIENHIRLYTLNYDRVFKILLQDIGIDCFEGFEIDEEVFYHYGLRANVPKILNEFNCNVHYNLHGSSFWKVIPRNDNQLTSPEIVYSGTPEFPLSEEHANLQMEKGKPVYLTNIITGYQKAQKTIITPFKQMNAAFDIDCCNANKITIIGYSFGDEHINESIKTALRFNKQIKIEIVSPNFIKKKMDEKLILTLFQYLDNRNYNPKKVSENKFSYFNDQIIVYTLGFIEYLEQEKAAANNVYI